ncbi:efflux RND transporter periplasmic adaptor subunit [Nitrosomonas sp. JL21]|uniref:efflux RND transporter periplasmic adaptor subunit n=1 Tax=Nitrosomonas sp. JL21 TaxID=153949 RepID=UPI00136EB5B1|nr:efflux RND transporter periplasmic adaptor subunit [Nitrosomonas sp. JL21]MBL8496238.1 efflux RND transporter periplasmic adaptor subunit [Nitrosomonas sp.]MCC7090619.1 efflux RND transporter periplasmic adaptor subunit [Nitrosomonas sp.]MXS76994.1 efflux RND transporter periplasmic adaptor subunit [Nitrosomonas sp. JL21]
MITISFKHSIIAAAIISVAVMYWYGNENKEGKSTQYKTRTVERGDIVQSISANGTLTPVVLVNVGTQISGTVAKLYADYNDQVEIGQILAELDPALLRAQLQQSKANLLNAQVAVKIAEAKLKRNRLLKEKEFISPEALEIVEQEVEAAHAQLAISKAQVERDQANLNYSVIRSPISGVVIARDVDIGQTVAANFQTPTLFQIAKDLRRMQINISVAEADIGQLHIDQSINFTVDAFPQRKYTGTVRQVRLNPTIQENVVTYNVVAMVDNEDGTLLPGMTANIHFVVMQKTDVLRVSNAALRYQPKDNESSQSPKPAKSTAQSTVYRLSDNQSIEVSITTGITDGNFTEIVTGDINEGDKVIISEIVDKKESESKFKLRVF